MKWKSLNVTGDMGLAEGLPCSICALMVTDEIYFLTDYEDAPEEAKALVEQWEKFRRAEAGADDTGALDPYVDFHVCVECKDGQLWPSELALDPEVR
jgi:hypothetical protein